MLQGLTKVTRQVSATQNVLFGWWSFFSFNPLVGMEILISFKKISVRFKIP